MAELKEVFEMVTKQTEPDLDSWKQQEEQQRRAARNRKVGVYALVAAVVMALAVFAVSRLPSTDNTALTNTPTPTVPIVTTPPMGVQGVSATNGEALRQLLPSIPGAVSFQLSPDGSTLAYVNAGDVHTVLIDGTNDQTLTSGNTNSGNATEHVAWSPDGSQLAYGYSGDIWVMNADGTDQHAITHAAGRMGYYYPVWSVDGTIAMWGAPDPGPDGGPDDSEIYTVPAIGGAVTRLTHDSVNSIEPAWSPDGTRLAYFNNGGLWTMRADGSNQRLLLKEGYPWAPSWSPNGDAIATLWYVGDLPGTDQCCYMQLRIFDLRTGTFTRLPVHSVTDGNGPQWFSDNEILINRYD